MGNVSLRVLELFVQKSIQNLLTIPTSQNKSEPTTVSTSPRNTGMVVLEELIKDYSKKKQPLHLHYGQNLDRHKLMVNFILSFIVIFHFLWHVFKITTKTNK